MSRSDHFLSRWSRLKQEAARRATDSDDRQPAPSTLERAEQPGERAPASAPQASAEDFDPATLPPLDTIGPGTDIRGFLKHGVPAALKQAALRRAWAADPAIRDFIGLSENSWDFTAPGGVPGFGPMRPADDIQELLAHMGGRRPLRTTEGASGTSPIAESVDSPAADLPTEADREGGGEVAHAGEHEPVSTADRPAAPEALADMHCATIDNKNKDVAVREAKQSRELLPVAAQRRHGGALPD